MTLLLRRIIIPRASDRGFVRAGNKRDLSLNLKSFFCYEFCWDEGIFSASGKLIEILHSLVF